MEFPARSRFELAVIVLALLLLVCAVPATATVTREGVFVEEVRDDFGAQAGAVTTYRLKSDGSAIPLVPTRPSSAATGDRVTVTGRVREGELVGAVTSVDAGSAAIPSGARKVAVVLIKFPGDKAEPFPASEVRERVFTGSNSANAFYQEETKGRISLTGDVFGWFTLKEPTTTCPYEAWRTEGRAAAEAAGISLAGYDHLIFVNAPHGCSAAGIAQIGGREVNVFGNYQTKTYAHELGHNLGLHHASSETCTQNGVPVAIGPTCTISEYGDIFDVMGVPNTRHNNSAGLEQLGVLGPENVRTVTTSGTYSIKAALLPGLETASLRIPRTTDSKGSVASWYYLETRARGGIFEDVVDASTTGVSVRIAPVPLTSARTILLDTNPATSTFADAPLVAGGSFDDGGVRITTVSAGSGRATVSIEITGSQPDTHPPTAPAQLSASQTGAHTTSLSWAASSDDVFLEHYAVFRDGTQIGTTQITSFVDPSSPIGPHAYTVHAVDEAGNRSPASTPLVVTVGDVTAPSPPGKLTVTQSMAGVTLSWQASFDDLGVTRYAIFRDEEMIGTAPTTTFLDTQSREGKTHLYAVYAEDAAGNRSLGSASKVFAVSDLKAPSTPTSLSGSWTPLGVVLTWAPSSDNLGVSQYVVFRGQVETGKTTSATFTDHFPGSGSRSYTVYAEDSAGNRSPASEALTIGAIGEGPAPTGPKPTVRPRPRLRWHRQANGKFLLEVDARRDPEAVRVELRLDNRRLRARNGLVLTTTWDPVQAPSCSRFHRLVGRAYDAAGVASAATARIRVESEGRGRAGCRLLQISAPRWR